MSSRFEVFDPRAVEHIPDWRIGQALRQEQFEREKLSRQGTKVLGPDQSLIDAAGNVIATGPEKRPTVTEQMKIEDQAKAKEAKGRDRDLIASTAASLLESGDFKDAFGTVDSLAPTVLASTADAEADIDRLVSLLSLGAREKLKGTGQISDFESKQLEKSASILSDRTISDEKAQKELENIAEIFGGIRPRKNAIGVKSGRFTIRAK